MFGKQRYLWVGVCALIVATAGLYIGKLKEKDFLDELYLHRDFTLLDDNNDFFTLSAFPRDQRLLLIFTPDGLPPEAVGPFAEFSRRLADFQQRKIQVMLVTRTNKEIVMNFKAAARFPGRVLSDLSGTVGRTVGVWPSLDPVDHWGYVLVDHAFNQLFAQVANRPVSADELLRQIPR